jgi:hypothetical protein
MLWCALNARQVFTAAEAFGSARTKMASLGFKVNDEESGLVFRPNAPVEVSCGASNRAPGLL